MSRRARGKTTRERGRERGRQGVEGRQAEERERGGGNPLINSLFRSPDTGVGLFEHPLMSPPSTITHRPDRPGFFSPFLHHHLQPTTTPYGSLHFATSSPTPDLHHSYSSTFTSPAIDKQQQTVLSRTHLPFSTVFLESITTESRIISSNNHINRNSFTCLTIGELSRRTERYSSHQVQWYSRKLGFGSALTTRVIKFGNNKQST